MCDQSESIALNPYVQKLKVIRIEWRNMGDHDRVTFTLQRDGSQPGTSKVVLDEVTPDTVAPDHGLPPPAADSDWAILVRFDGDIRSTDITGSPSQPAVRSLVVAHDSSGVVYGVIGVKGGGCYQLQVPRWEVAAPPPPRIVDVVVDIKH